LYASPNIIRVITSRRRSWADHVAGMEDINNVFKILVRQREGKTARVSPRRRWEDNIRVDLTEMGEKL